MAGSWLTASSRSGNLPSACCRMVLCRLRAALGWRTRQAKCPCQNKVIFSRSWAGELAMRSIQAVLMLMKASRMPWFCILRCSGVRSARRRRGTPAARVPPRSAERGRRAATGAAGAPGAAGWSGVVAMPLGTAVFRAGAGAVITAPCGSSKRRPGPVRGTNAAESWSSWRRALRGLRPAATSCGRGPKPARQYRCCRC